MCKIIMYHFKHVNFFFSCLKYFLCSHCFYASFLFNAGATFYLSETSMRLLQDYVLHHHDVSGII